MLPEGRVKKFLHDPPLWGVLSPRRDISETKSVWCKCRETLEFSRPFKISVKKETGGIENKSGRVKEIDRGYKKITRSSSNYFGVLFVTI